MIKALLEHGANPNIKDKKGFVPLQLAVDFVHGDYVEALLKNGADPHVSEHAGILSSSTARHIQILLIEAQEKWNKKNYSI